MKSSKHTNANNPTQNLHSPKKWLLDWPEVRRQVLRSYPSIDGCLRPQLFGRQKAVKSIEDAGKADGFPPQRGGDRVNGTELRN